MDGSGKNLNATFPVDNIDSPKKSLYSLLSAVFVFSTQDVLIKLISGKYPVHEIVLIRSCIAILPILLIAHLDGGLHLLRIRNYAGHFIRSFFMFAAYTCFFMALSALPIAETVSLFFSTPIFITILSVLILREKVDLRDWLAVFAGFSGVLIMLKPGSTMIDPASILAIMSALFYAIASIITRRLGRTESGVSIAFYMTIMYLFFSTIIAVVLTQKGISNNSHPSLAFLFREWGVPAKEDWFLFLCVGTLAAAGFYFQSQAYRLAQPSKIASFEYLAVPLSVFWGYIIWQDILEVQSVIGMMLIVCSGLYIFGRKKALAKNERG